MITTAQGRHVTLVNILQRLGDAMRRQQAVTLSGIRLQLNQ